MIRVSASQLHGLSWERGRPARIRSGQDARAPRYTVSASAPKVADAVIEAEHRAALARVLDLPEANIPTSPGTSVARMADDDRLYCFLFIGTQMTKNMPRVGYWSRRLGRSFNIVIDSFLGEGVLEHADVLLPSLTYTERTGVIQRGDRTLQLQQRVTEPPALAWSDSKILARLALKIAERLRDPDTAELNELDPDVVHRTFARYLDDEGEAVPARIFDHLVAVNRELDVYCRLEDSNGTPISHELLRQQAGMGVQRVMHRAKARQAELPSNAAQEA